MDYQSIGKSYVREATACLKELGVRVRLGTDFEDFRRAIERQSDRAAQAPGFDPRHELGEGLDGIWLAAYDQDGEVVHTQAARLETIAPDMRTDMINAGGRYEPSYWQFDRKPLDVRLSPEAQAISGRAIYHGEFWLRGGAKGIRGRSTVFLLSRLMIAANLARWPDAAHSYGLLTPQNCAKGLPIRAGYTRCEQRTLVFSGGKGKPPIELWMMWMTQGEMVHTLSSDPSYFVETFEPQELAEAA